ncbi:MAG: threonine synthase [Bacteroidetes bacterium]|nr:threonine synthase [Bacteroidota bacterium]
MKKIFHYRCNDCGEEYSSGIIRYLCPACNANNKADQPPKGVLKTIYSYKSILDNLDGKDCFQYLVENQFLPLLPIQSLESLPKLRVGNTPLYKSFDVNETGESFEVFLKDDSQNPTFSFKDRASAIVSAWARENDIDTIVAASTGNAGSSLAGICASQGQKSMIFVPAKAPIAKLTQIVMYGARIIPVDGTYDQAFDLSVAASEQFGFYNRNTAFNPLTIEGKKTVAFEIYEQLGRKAPDRIFVPVGDGVIISGVYKGFEDLLELEIIQKMPTIVAVQAEGSNNLIRNLDQSRFIAYPSNTIADSISVDIPRNYHMAVKYLKTFKGETISVSDKEIIDASVSLSRSSGIFSEPAAATAYAGYIRFKSTSRLAEGSRNVVLLTGSGLKDLQSVQSRISLPKPVSPELSSLNSLFSI